MIPVVLRPARDAAKESVGTDGQNTIMQTATGALNAFLGSFGAVAAQNAFGQNQATAARQPAPTPSGFGDWFRENTALAIGLGVGLLVLVGFMFRRR